MYPSAPTAFINTAVSGPGSISSQSKLKPWSACLEAHRITGDKSWHKEARRAFEWFLGRNDLNLSIYDPTTGGCRDGLHADRPNENQGAESSLAFLQAVLELRSFENMLQSMEVLGQ